MKNKIKLIKIAVILFTQLSHASENYETVVSDHSFSSTSQIVISEEQIKNSRATNLTGLLQTQANISVSNSNIQPNSIYLRGGDSSHILILVDGVPFYDGTSSQRTFDLNSLDLRSVRRIEVLKGSQSVLYGGQALSGVIKIDTLPMALTNKSQLSIATGSQNLLLASGSRVQKISDSDAVIFKASTLSKNTLSAVQDSNIHYPSNKLSAELSYLHRDDWTWLVKASFINNSSENVGSDPMGKYLGAVENKEYLITKKTNGVQTYLKKSFGKIKPQFSIGYVENDSDYFQHANSLGYPETHQSFQAKTLNSRFDLNYLHSDSLVMDFGAQSTHENFEGDFGNGSAKVHQDQTLNGVFIKATATSIENLKLELGGRGDKVSNMDSLFGTYQLGMTFFGNSKLEYSTGFKTPSLYQLYAGTYGNPALLPEKATSFSASQNYYLNDDALISFTYFDTQFTNLILASGSPTKYQNVGIARTLGIETEISLRFQNTQAQFSIGYQEPKDVSANNWLLRRPLQTVGARIHHKLFEDSSLTFEYLSNGVRRDQAYRGPSVYRTLQPFSVAHATYAQTFKNQMTGYIRANNVFDSKYEEQVGYYNEGLALQIGFDWTI